VGGASSSALIKTPPATKAPREAMKIGIVVSLGIGATFSLLSGSAPNAAEANASVPVASAPTPLVPAAYTASAAPVVPVASLPSAPVAPTASQPSANSVPIVSPSVETRLFPPTAPAIAAEGRAVPAPVFKFNQYYPHWVVDLH
jgi:hypothetical protein